MSNSHLILTGAYGFVARHLLASLLLNKAFKHYILIDDCSSNCFYDLSNFLSSFKNIDLKKFNITCIEEKVQSVSPDNLKRSFNLIPNQYTIIHLAANTGVQPSINDPLLDFESNTLGTFNLLCLAKLVPPSVFIFSSSGAPIGSTDVLPIHENIPTRPIRMAQVSPPVSSTFMLFLSVTALNLLFYVLAIFMVLAVCTSRVS